MGQEPGEERVKQVQKPGKEIICLAAASAWFAVSDGLSLAFRFCNPGAFIDLDCVCLCRPPGLESHPSV